MFWFVYVSSNEARGSMFDEDRDTCLGADPSREGLLDMDTSLLRSAAPRQLHSRSRFLGRLGSCAQVTSFAPQGTAAGTHSPSVQHGSPMSSPVPPTSFQSVTAELLDFDA